MRVATAALTAAVSLLTVAASAATGAADAGHHGPWYTHAETYVAVAFVLFILIVLWKGRNAVVGPLDARAARIRTDLDEAARLRAEAAALAADAKNKYDAAIKDAESIVTQARAEAQRLREKAERDLADSIARRETQASDRIAQAEAQAVAAIRARTVELSVTAARDLATDALQGQTASSLVDRTIAALDRSAA